MIDSLRHFLIGPPLPTRQLAGERLNKVRALAAFSPDALSSIAYANQEIYLGLVVAGSLGLSRALPIGLAITGAAGHRGPLVLPDHPRLSVGRRLLRGGPREPGHAARPAGGLGALLVDYVLTAAVSLTAGVEAIASAFPALWPYRVELSLAPAGVITLVNLRGPRETGTLMAVPVYLFLFTYLPMLAYGAFRLLHRRT